MIGCKFMCKISETLSDATGDTCAFGGLSVIFAGDFAQLPPVKATHLYACIDTCRREQTSSFQDTITGKMLWLSIDVVIHLHHLHRQQGHENSDFQALLSRLREGRCNAADFNLLNSRVLTPSSSIDFSIPPWRDAPIIVYNNATKDSLNIKAAIAFAQQTSQSLQWYYSADFYKRSPIDDNDLIDALTTLHSGETNQHLTCIPLVIGMPVLVSHNFSVDDGVVNGARGTIRTIQYTIDNKKRHRLLSVVINIPDSTDVSFLDLPPHDYPILPDYTDFHINHPFSHMKLSIVRQQIPLQPAFAVTAHRSQGQTLSQAIIDLESCKGTEAPYVMISRV